MSSILTNNSAMTALQSLNATQAALNATQSQISTGLRIQSASDNAAYWSISTTMKSDTSALSAVTDALNLGGSVVSAASAAVNATITIMNKLKADLVTAQTPGVNAAQVQSDITAQQQSLLNIISSASFNGVNLLDGSSGSSAQVAASFTRAAATGGGTSANVGFIGIDTSTAGTQLTGSTSSYLGQAITGLSANAALMNSGTAYTTGATPGTSGTVTTGTAAEGASGTYAAGSILSFDVTKVVGTATSAADLTAIAQGIDAAITNITTVGAKLGAVQSQISNQTTFVSALSDAITSGVGSLVDADMNAASTRLNALQTQQQLGVQSLSIANQNAQLILKLFQ